MREISISLVKPDANKKVVGAIFTGILLLFGGVVTFSSTRTINKGNETSHWTPTVGKVLWAKTRSPADGPDFLDVSYEYSFMGVQHRGSRLCFGFGSVASERLESVLAGKSITVFVNPEQPDESVLVTGVVGEVKIFLGVGVFIILLGVIVGLSTVNCRQTVAN